MKEEKKGMENYALTASMYKCFANACWIERVEKRWVYVYVFCIHRVSLKNIYTQIVQMYLVVSFLAVCIWKWDENQMWSRESDRK